MAEKPQELLNRLLTKINDEEAAQDTSWESLPKIMPVFVTGSYLSGSPARGMLDGELEPRKVATAYLKGARIWDAGASSALVLEPEGEVTVTGEVIMYHKADFARLWKMLDSALDCQRNSPKGIHKRDLVTVTTDEGKSTQAFVYSVDAAFVAERSYPEVEGGAYRDSLGWQLLKPTQD